MTIESRLTNTIQMGPEICGWIQNYFFLKKEHKTSHTTQTQNAVLISWLFKAKPPNHTFWNSHSVSIITDTLSGERKTEVAFHTVPLSALTTTLEGYLLSLGILLPNGTTWSRETKPDLLQDACGPPLGCEKAGITALLRVKRNKDLRIRLLSPRWVCQPLGHRDVPYSSGLVGWNVTKKRIFRTLAGQSPQAW